MKINDNESNIKNIIIINNNEREMKNKNNLKEQKIPFEDVHYKNK